MSSRKTQHFFIPHLILITMTASAVAAFVPFQVATITLDPSTTYQTFDGWEATANAGQIDGPLYAVHAGWANDSPVLMDLLVNDLGLTRLRVSVVSGSENPIDYYQQFKDRLIDRPSGWNPHLYDVVNDNNDPFVTDASKFHWTELDQIITMLAVPFRERVIASGQTPYIDLCYVDFKNVSAFKHSDDPNEYAEFVLAAFQHIQATFGWVPDGLEVVLEGDLAERWQDPGKIGRSLAAASTRLAAAGFHPEFIAPSSTSLMWAVNQFDALVGVPGVLPALKTVAYHLYWDNADSNLISLGAKAKAFGLKTAMNEFIGATYLHLSNDLRKANVSAWAQYQMAAYNQNDQGAKYYIHNGATYVPGDRTRYLRQYMRYVRPGAVRIGAASVTAELTPVAFINSGDRYTVVVNATSAQSLTIDNLPAGTYGIRYTTATETDVNPGNQTIAAGGLISTSIPGAGAITIFSTAPGPGPTPTPTPTPTPAAFAKTGPSGGATGLSSTPTLSWTASAGATGYEYCLDTINNDACDTSWLGAGTGITTTVTGLAPGTTYFWQIRAINASGTPMYANGSAGAFVYFTTQPATPESSIHAVPFDFTGDGKSDVLWRHDTSGEVWLWPMNGAAKLSENSVRTVPDINWEIRGQGDQNGDGKADILWRNRLTGSIVYWPMNGATPLSETFISTVDPAYDIVGTGDYNGDGKSDILCRHATNGQVWMWLMNGATALSIVYVDTVDPIYRIDGSGDLDHDGKADIVWRNTNTGDVWVWLMNGTTRLSQTMVGTVSDLDYQIVSVADFTGDGRADILWHHTSEGHVWIWPMNGAALVAQTYVATVDPIYTIAGTGDYDGDGRADLFWHRANTGDVWTWLMNGALRLSETFITTVPDLGYQIVKWR
jgi:hypothetical protein